METESDDVDMMEEDATMVVSGQNVVAWPRESGLLVGSVALGQKDNVCRKHPTDHA